MNFQSIWNNIINCAGEEFKTITGLPFTYRIEDNYVIPDRTEYPLAKSNFEKAAAVPNLSGPGQINFISRGPSYVYAILSDKRITGREIHRTAFFTDNNELSNSSNGNSLKEQLVNGINKYVKVHGDGIVLSGSEILDITRLTNKSRSIVPSDYCYNRYNKGLKTFEGPFLFEYVDINQYRILGENYKYTGNIIHKPKFGSEYIVGQWNDGYKKMYQESDFGSRNRETLKYKGVVLALLHEGNKTVVYTSRYLTQDIQQVKMIFKDVAFRNPEVTINPAYIKNPADTYFSKCDFENNVDIDFIRSSIVKYYISRESKENSIELSALYDETRKIEEYAYEHNLEGTEKTILAKARVNQGVFRERLLRKYSKCCLCGADNDELLIASHIKPWSDSNPSEKVDVNNGLLLCPNHDHLFDKGFISFDDDGHILISPQLSSNNRVFMNVNNDMFLDMTVETKEYMRFHREMNKSRLMQG